MHFNADNSSHFAHDSRTRQDLLFGMNRVVCELDNTRTIFIFQVSSQSLLGHYFNSLSSRSLTMRMIDRNMTASKLSSPLDPLLASLAHFSSSSELSAKVHCKVFRERANRVLQSSYTFFGLLSHSHHAKIRFFM